MGEGTPRLETSRHTNGDRPANVEDLSSEIAVVRGELDTLLGELDRRRHDLLDVPLQVRRHATGLSLGAVALAATVSASIWLTQWRRRNRERPGAKANRLRYAVARMTAHPDRVAAEPTVMEKIAVAAANAVVAGLVKKLLERGLQTLLDTHRVGGGMADRILEGPQRDGSKRGGADSVPYQQAERRNTQATQRRSLAATRADGDAA
jgi:hypothetical protein